MNDPQEFLKFFLRQQDDIRAFIGSIVRDRHACDDILQDVALILWQKFGQYDRARPFGAWARGIASKRIMQTFEKQKRIPLPLSPEAIQAVLEACDAEAAEVGPEQEALRRCLEGLPETSRELVRLRYEQALKLKDIAARVQGTLDAVHKTLSRLRVALRKCVEQQLALEGGAR
jgi:RNA polymerase sigma-70 factor, ECF subfamily